MAGGLTFLLQRRTTLAAGMIGAKGFDKSSFSLRDKNGFSVCAAEGEIGRFARVEPDLPRQRSLRVQLRCGAFEDSRHQNIPLDVGAQAVDVKIIEALDKFGREKARAFDPVPPDLPCVGLADIECLAVRTGDRCRWLCSFGGRRSSARQRPRHRPIYGFARSGARVQRAPGEIRLSESRFPDRPGPEYRCRGWAIFQLRSFSGMRNLQRECLA